MYTFRQQLCMSFSFGFCCCIAGSHWIGTVFLHIIYNSSVCLAAAGVDENLRFPLQFNLMLLVPAGKTWALSKALPFEIIRALPIKELIQTCLYKELICRALYFSRDGGLNHSWKFWHPAVVGSERHAVLVVLCCTLYRCCKLNLRLRLQNIHGSGACNSCTFWV